jgi:DNA-binding transcriptional LysR family regulator
MLELTSEGSTLARYARRILALNDEALAVLNSPRVSGRIRLGAPHEYTASLLPDLLGRFAQSHPDVMLEVTSDLSRSLLQRQQNGEFDLVVALHEQGSATSGERIHTEPLLWFSSADHAGHRQDPLPLVLAPPPCIYRQRMLQTLEDSGRTVRVCYLSSTYDAILAAVRAGLGVTAMARSTIPADAQILTEREGLPPLGQLEVRLHLARGSGDGGAIGYLKNYISGSFGNSPPK